MGRYGLCVLELVNDWRHRVAGHGPPSKNRLRRSLARVTGKGEIGEKQGESEKVENENRRILFLKPKAQMEYKVRNKDGGRGVPL